MKKKYLYGSAAALLLSLASYQLGRYQESAQQDEHRVSYVDGESSDKGKKGIVTDTKNLTPDEVSAREGIDAEQIVVKITDQGYVTAHGDHYHYYNGKIPYDAIISEELILKDSSYVLNQADIVNEVKDGYIIKINGQYYLYLKDASKTSNVRTKEEIARQQQGTGTNRPSHQTGDDKRHNHQPGQQATTGQPYTTDDGYVFNPTDVIDDLGDGFLVPHGDHFHFIPKKDLSAGELAAAQAYWDKKQNKPAPAPQPRPQENRPANQVTPAPNQPQSTTPNQSGAQQHQPSQPSAPSMPPTVQPSQPSTPTQPTETKRDFGRIARTTLCSAIK